METTEVKQRLKSFVQRIERLEDDKADLSTDLKEVYGEAKSSGFDVKALRTVIKLRKKSKEERQELEEIVGLYLDAVEG